MFDLNDFTGTQVDQPNQTKLILVPPGTYKAQLDEFSRPKEMLDEKTNAPSGRAVVEVWWNLMDPEGRIKAITNNDKNRVKQALWLDLLYQKDSSGQMKFSGLDFGTNRNLGLGRLRETLGMNSGGPFRPAQLIGQVATVEVVHNPDSKKPDVSYAEVSKIAPAMA